ncbi:MAG: hypothetical protein EXQ52_16980 [Bryobacterales bacterium]|nr:hypothetical protein [Bryobacterales bacterium]
MTAKPPEDLIRDLGFGARVAERSQLRLLNRDGTFNVARRGLPFLQSLNLYHSLLTISWGRFYLLVTAAYVVVNAAFAAAYLQCGEGALEGAAGHGVAGRFLEAFFFSVQTLATIGYGRISPRGMAANTIVAMEALAGLLGFALATGLLFARFSRPQAKVLFSSRAVVAPYHTITGFMLRIANQRTSEFSEVQATVLLILHPVEGGRKFLPLTLERPKVAFLPMHWVIVHPIDEQSPMYGMTPENIQELDAEVIVLLTALDEATSQMVHTRSSYKWNEIAWHAKFADMFTDPENGIVTADLRRIHDIERVR